MNEKKNRPLISIAAPCFNEEPVLRSFYEELCRVIEPLDEDFEIIFINDGSRDSTQDIIEELADRDSRVQGIEFSRNFGQQAALTAGYDFARGDAVITMDSDLQHPPALIPDMIEQWKNGTEIVFGVRKNIKQDKISKKIFSMLFYWVFRKLAYINLPAMAPDFRLMDRRAVDAFISMKERTRFVRAMSHWVGFSSAKIDYEEKTRAGGRTKYSAYRMFGLAYRGILAFTRMPLHLLVFSGAAICMLSLIYGIYLLVAKTVYAGDVSGIQALAAAAGFLAGIQLAGIGLVGEYVGQIYEEVRRRPIYIVRRITGDTGGSRVPDSDPLS